MFRFVKPFFKKNPTFFYPLFNLRVKYSLSIPCPLPVLGMIAAAGSRFLFLTGGTVPALPVPPRFEVDANGLSDSSCLPSV